jgi:hypothetical protein
VQLLDQLGVERITHVEQHAQQVAPAAGQQARGAVGAVAQLGRGGQHAFPGLGARTGRAAQHERHRCGRDAGAGGDVGQPRSLIH